MTPRVASLIEAAKDLIVQAMYEGSHIQRQEPEPKEGSPWDRPDLPNGALVRLVNIQHDIEELLSIHVGKPQLDRTGNWQRATTMHEAWGA